MVVIDTDKVDGQLFLFTDTAKKIPFYVLPEKEKRGIHIHFYGQQPNAITWELNFATYFLEQVQSNSA
jgi:hypothetical protein